MRITVILLFCFMLVLPFCTTSKLASGKKQKGYYYTTDVAPIIQDRCTPCHFPETGKKKFLDTYTAVSTTIDDIIYRVELPSDHPKFMPFKSKKEPLSDSLITVIKLWKEGGMKQSPR